MIIYNVTIKIDNNVREEWLNWMRTVHIPEVLNTGYFQDHQIARVLGQDESEATTYAVQYTCSDMKTLQEYSAKAAPALQRATLERYPNGQLVAFRTMLEIVD
jgi:hypothetical protein